MSYTAMPPDEEANNAQLDELQFKSQQEADHLGGELREIEMIIRQNQIEVDKLSPLIICTSETMLVASLIL